MFRTLIATAATAAIGTYAYRLYREGRLDGALSRLTGTRQPFPLDGATDAANVSKPAPAHPWPVDARALPAGAGAD